MLDKGVYVFMGIEPSNLVEIALKLDPAYLESSTSLDISKYCLALAQYLIYLKYEVNKLKAELVKKKDTFNDSLSISLTKEVVKQHGTKTAATEFLVSTVPKLTELKNHIDVIKEELTLVDGIDKQISEYIMVFKRELTRREQELYTSRTERRL